MSRAFVKEDAEPAQVQWRRASGAEGDLPLTLSGANRLAAELERLAAGDAAGSKAGGGDAARIAQLEVALARSEIVDVRKLAGDQVTFGATVVLQPVDPGPQVRYQLVGELEVDLALGRIGVTSPIARALIGREVGELVQVRTPRGAHEYEIVELLWVESEA
jgi:transcription elongation factor GreA